MYSGSSSGADASSHIPPNKHHRRVTHFWQSHLSRERPFQNKATPSGHKYRHEDDRPEEVPHPLRLFPRPQDHVTSVWMSKRTKMRLADYDRVYPWVVEGEEDHLGILEAPSLTASTTRLKSVNDVIHNRQAHVRRAWRELMRQGLLNKTDPMLGPVKEEVIPAPKAACGEYIMVRADILQEHLLLGASNHSGGGGGDIWCLLIERKLRRDRASLKEQCTWYFTDSNMSAREALPLVKMAVDEVCDREMAQAVQSYRVLCNWRPHRANPHMTKPPLPRLEGSDGPDEEQPEGAVGVNGRKEEDSLSVQARVLCRASRMPVRERFGYVTDLLTQIERHVGKREMECMAHEERLTRQAWRWLEAWERKKDYEVYYTLAGIFGILSQDLFDRTSRPGKFYHSALSRSTRTIQQMWKRLWPRRKKKKFKAARAMQTIWRAFVIRKRWTPIVKLRCKCGYRAQMRYSFRRWLKIIRSIIGVREGFIRANRRHMANHFNAWFSYVLQEIRSKKEQGMRLMLRIKRRYMKQIVGVWRKYAENSIRIKTNFRRCMNNPYFKWWADYVDMIKFHKKELKLARICQALGRGMFARRKVRDYKKHLEFLRYNIKRLYCMKQYHKKLSAKREQMVLDYVASKQDKLVQPLIVKETARLDGLKKEQDNVGQQGGTWLKEEDLKHAMMAIKHNYEATNPPPYRSPDPNHPQTFILPEHLEQQHPDWAPLYFLLIDAIKVQEFYNYVARVYGTTDMLWTVNYWRAVEALRGLTTTSDAFFMKRLKIRMLQIVDRYLSPNSVNPARVQPSVANHANSAADGLRHLSPFTWGTQRLASYGSVLQALYEGQFQAFLSLTEHVAPQFWESEYGRNHLAEVKAQKMARWKKDEEVVLAKHHKELMCFASEMRNELKRRTKHLEEAINNQAATVINKVADRVVELAVGDACTTYAVRFNDLVDEVLVDTVKDVEDTVIKGLFKDATDVVVEEAYVEQLAAMVVDDVIFHVVTQEMIMKAMEGAYEQIEKETEERATKGIERAVMAVAEELIRDIAQEIDQEKAVVTIQCMLRTRLAIKKCRGQVAKHLIKVWDPTYQMYYYYNDLTGESSWEKPHIIDKVFHTPALTYH